MAQDKASKAAMLPMCVRTLSLLISYYDYEVNPTFWNTLGLDWIGMQLNKE